MKKLHFAIVFCFVFVACAESPKGEQAEKETGAIKEKVADTFTTPPVSNEEKVEEVPETVLEATDNDGNPVTVTIRAEADALDSLGYIKITLPHDSVKGYLFEAHPWHETVFGPPEDYDGNPLDEADLSMTPWYRITSLSPLAIEFHVTFETVGLTKEHADYATYSYLYSTMPFSPYKESITKKRVCAYMMDSRDQEIELVQISSGNFDSLQQTLKTLHSVPRVKKELNRVFSTSFAIKATQEGISFRTGIDSVQVHRTAEKYKQNLINLFQSFPILIEE